MHFLGLLLTGVILHAQDSTIIDKRLQYPVFLRKAFFGVSVGYINYPFSNQHLEPGFAAEGVQVPNLGVKVTLLGYRFNENLSAQITYMRPVWWTEYRNINGTNGRHSVFMNVGGLTFMGRLPVTGKLALTGEGGLAIVTRNEVQVNGQRAVRSFTHATYIVGGGVAYRLNRKWDLQASATFTPSSRANRQPAITSVMAGFRYHMQPIPDDVVRKRAAAGYHFPKTSSRLVIQRTHWDSG